MTKPGDGTKCIVFYRILFYFSISYFVASCCVVSCRGMSYLVVFRLLHDWNSCSFFVRIYISVQNIFAVAVVWLLFSTLTLDVRQLP